MSTKLADRDWLVRLNGVAFDKLDADFEIKKSLRKEPNTARLTVYGLHEKHRKKLDELNIYEPEKGHKRGPKFAPTQSVSTKAPKKGKISVEIEAGYRGSRSLIFSGFLRRAITTRSGADTSVEIQGEDGGEAMSVARVAKSYPPDTRQLDVVKDCALALGLGLGNIIEVVPSLQGIYSHGTTIDGSAADVLEGLLRGARLSYSIQNGALAFRASRSGLKTRGLHLSKTTGLIGKPSRDPYGAVVINTLLVPNMSPGQLIYLESDEFKGTYYAKTCTTTGQTKGAEWGHALECYPG